METSSAYLLVFHGSRDPRPQAAVTRLAALVRQQLARESAVFPDRVDSVSLTVLTHRKTVVIDTASLELAEIPLHERVEQCARIAGERGLTKLTLIPLFLFAGVHVREDIPTAVAMARSKLSIELKPHLGSYRGIVPLLGQKFADFPASARVLLSHGSRHPLGGSAVESLAVHLGAIPAYWSVAPPLSAIVEMLIESGHRSIAILPYFLFPGTITDEIERQVLSLSQQYKNVRFRLGKPLGANPELAQVIVEEMN